jgi:hypothetical protein
LTARDCAGAPTAVTAKLTATVAVAKIFLRKSPLNEAKPFIVSIETSGAQAGSPRADRIRTGPFRTGRARATRWRVIFTSG